MASYLAKRLVLFKNRSFVFTCIMDFFSAMAVGMTYISLSWHLLTIYNSVNAIIIFMLTWWVAETVLSPLTGYFADRYPRRMIVLTANALRVVIIFIYLFICQL
ncbi:hypothetical protein [Facilibium subflavum]|uniref:hypothetical protein n=1 Tax=Facilibium subflavum TaxID=2219058 RepID=UPI000E6506FB|nr:hypothetical protein [Facilibium subflavum]